LKFTTLVPLVALIGPLAWIAPTFRIAPALLARVPVIVEPAFVIFRVPLLAVMVLPSVMGAEMVLVPVLVMA
jgi:hypothetical protein